MRARLAEWAACKRGVSAVEFGLLAPVLLVSLIGTVDLGLAMSDRMNVDHVLRAGAQEAIADPGESAVATVMQATAGSDPISLTVTRFCACPTDPGTPVGCSTVCSGSAPTYIYYRMQAQDTYDPILLPTSIDFDRAMQVQIR